MQPERPFGKGDPWARNEEASSLLIVSARDERQQTQDQWYLFKTSLRTPESKAITA
jgi:hypothetical protein